MNFWNLKKTYTGDVPPKGTVGIYCSASAFRDACYQLVSSFLITYITFAGLLDTQSNANYLKQMAAISVIIVIYRIWDGINDPIMGWIIEKVHFKWGKYKPWIFIGSVMNTVVVLVLFLAHPTGWAFVVLFAVFYFLWDIAWTINDIAYWSMLPSLTKDEERRNNITTVMQIFISIGTFAVYGAVPMLVGAFENVSAQTVYGVIATVVTLLFFISQMIVCAGCREHVRNREDEEREQNDVKFSDLFTLYKKNDQFRVNIIAILLNYLGSGVLVGFGMYYFYLMFGYGSDNGGGIQFMFTIMYAVGTLLSQFAYPFLAKRFTRKKIYALSTVAIIIGYAMVFFLGFPVFGPRPLADNMMILLHLGGLILFFGQGIVAVAIIIQMQATIEYNEWKYGERKEAIVSSMRALVAKWASAIQQALIYVTLLLSGLYSVSQVISKSEQALNAGLMTSDEMFNMIEAARMGITSGQFITLSAGMIIAPLILLLISIWLSTKVFKIDEVMYKKICEDLDRRHEEDK
ncbi:MAG: glycoside-pentoside-hexuronide (GPH):cation symporter [Clostridia bacterium]|nr:glycoside-pentoside-hexuronide (GPH):cation symporter [Clostridia bacterium]